MNDTSSLLGQLRIDRSQSQVSESRAWVWWAGGVVGLVVLGIAAWLVLAAPSGIAVHAVTARPAAGNGPSAGASLLDASGYVVARRQATVSSKITGKVR